eukprot:gene32442-40041_t
MCVGKLITPPPLNFDDNRNIPPQFKHLGLAFWWGAVQHRLFRFLPVVDNYILEKSHGLNNNKGFPFSLPTVGMHVRHGDKSSDGWADHSLSDMMVLAKKSEDCRVKNAAVTPLHVFVASDDSKVTHSANNLNYMTLPEGVSQQTDKKLGMQHSLMADPMLAFNATLEIIADMYFLSQCSTLLGISASQVFRASVAMSNATGTLHQAYAMDAKEVKKIVEMSVFYHVPFPENFLV